jgi:hypothetical protein
MYILKNHHSSEIAYQGTVIIFETCGLWHVCYISGLQDPMLWNLMAVTISHTTRRTAIEGI